MGIVMHDQNEYVMEFSIPGVQGAAATILEVMTVPFPGVIRGILARVDTAGVTGTQVTDIKLNGTSIFATAAKLTWASASRVPTYDDLTASPLTVAKGDTITVVTPTTVHTTPANSLAIQTNIRRGRASQYSKYAKDSISEMSDAI